MGCEPLQNWNKNLILLFKLGDVLEAAKWMLKDVDLSDPICKDEPVQIRIEDLIELQKRIGCVKELICNH